MLPEIANRRIVVVCASDQTASAWDALRANDYPGTRWPRAHGGDWLDLSNFETSCWACNSAKTDLLLEEVGWDVLSEPDMRNYWDGLTSGVEKLWVRAGAPIQKWRISLVYAAAPTTK